MREYGQIVKRLLLFCSPHCQIPINPWQVWYHSTPYKTANRMIYDFDCLPTIDKLIVCSKFNELLPNSHFSVFQCKWLARLVQNHRHNGKHRPGTGHSHCRTLGLPTNTHGQAGCPRHFGVGFVRRCSRLPCPQWIGVLWAIQVHFLDWLMGQKLSWNWREFN